jgi:hypothetical protein
MNTAFTRLLKIRGLLREFNFRRQSPLNPSYHVNTTDERGIRFMFSMTQGEEGSWKLSVSDLPSWINESEELIATAIQEAESQEQKKRTA